MNRMLACGPTLSDLLSPPLSCAAAFGEGIVCSVAKAIAFAKETTVKGGYDLSVWQVVRSEAARRPVKLVNRFDPKQGREAKYH